MTNRTIKFLTSNSITLMMVLACKPQTPLSQTETKAIGDTRYIFSSGTITVCFEDLGSENVAMQASREAIKAHVTGQFNRSNVSLVGWKSCESFVDTEDGIRISFEGKSKFGSPSRYGQSNLGISNGHSHFAKNIDGYSFQPTLTINYDVWTYKNAAGSKNLHAQNANTLLHEFGHALGLMHEHIRSSKCPNYGQQSFEQLKARQGFTSWMETYTASEKYDPNSIMDYCNIFDSNKMAKTIPLSKYDIDILNKLYPVEKMGKIEESKGSILDTLNDIEKEDTYLPGKSDEDDINKDDGWLY